jgi:hypothetical protein
LPRTSEVVEASESCMAEEPRRRSVIALGSGRRPVRRDGQPGSRRALSAGEANGSTELTDGKHFVWPQGLAHYVEAHDVRLPDDVMVVAERGPAGPVDPWSWNGRCSRLKRWRLTRAGGGPYADEVDFAGSNRRWSAGRCSARQSRHIRMGSARLSRTRPAHCVHG